MDDSGEGKVSKPPRAGWGGGVTGGETTLTTTTAGLPLVGGGVGDPTPTQPVDKLSKEDVAFLPISLSMGIATFVAERRAVTVFTVSMERSMVAIVF